MLEPTRDVDNIIVELNMLRSFKAQPIEIWKLMLFNAILSDSPPMRILGYHLIKHLLSIITAYPPPMSSFLYGALSWITSFMLLLVIFLNFDSFCMRAIHNKVCKALARSSNKEDF